MCSFKEISCYPFFCSVDFLYISITVFFDFSSWSQLTSSSQYKKDCRDRESMAVVSRRTVQSVTINDNSMSLIPIDGEVYTMQLNLIKDINELPTSR
jgi:hypothetical protein